MMFSIHTYRRSMREVDEMNLDEDYSVGMFDPNDEVTIKGTLVREIIRTQLQKIPDSYLVSLWKQEVKRDVSLKINRDVSGPILYIPEKTCIYAFLYGTLDNHDEKYWFRMKVPLITRSDNYDPLKKIKYCGVDGLVDECDDLRDTYDEHMLIYAKMPLETPPASKEKNKILREKLTHTMECVHESMTQMKHLQESMTQMMTQMKLFIEEL